MRNFFQHLAISFRLGYKDIINRISYNQKQDVNKKATGINNVFERVTDAFVALDKKWQYTYVNEKAAIMHGRKAQDLVGKNIWTEFPDVVNEPFYVACSDGASDRRRVGRGVDPVWLLRHGAIDQRDFKTWWPQGTP